MTKVLIIENSLYVTGGLNAILSGIDQLHMQFDFHFIIPEKSTVAEVITRKGYRVSKLPFLEISKSLKTLLYIPRLYQNARKVLQYMEAEKIQVLHVNDIFNLVGCLAKKLKPDIYLVNHVRLLKTSYIAPVYPFFAKQVIRHADAVVCVSEAVRNDLPDTKKALVIYDVPIITRRRREWSRLQEPETLKILYLGNYLPGKGQMHGLNAFIQLQKTYPATSITFAGSTNDAASEKFKQSLVTAAKEANVYGNVTISDKISDVEEFMKSHDVVLNLSESESFSFVCLEALLYGVPLIAANSGGPSEITEGGRRALLVQNKSPLLATEALKYIITHPQETKELAAASKLWATQKFNPQQTSQQLKELYKGKGYNILS